MFAEVKECLHCGKKFSKKEIAHSSKYCSQNCTQKAAYLRNHPEMKLRRFDPVLRQKVLEM
ncbi:MAG: hypothetical protein LBN97_08080, partial [Oscillospiraceae bacterium]|nr:hypothetical protein [Oscillospiraceae bacterium]